MKPGSLLIAAAVVVLANSFALVHALRNRTGPVSADVTLTERELSLSYVPNDEDSGVALNLRWIDPSWALYGLGRPAPWLDQRTLQQLGFDTSVSPSATKAYEFYHRQRARRAFVALEYDGPAWHKHVEDADRAVREHAGAPYAPAHSHDGESHLVAVDASADPALLRARHPDRNSVIIVPAVARILPQTWYPGIQGNTATAEVLSGSIEDIPASIHVPRPFSDNFRRLADRGRLQAYRVHLRYGASFEPWIVGVDFSTPSGAAPR